MAAPCLLLRPWTEADALALREAIDEDVSHVKPWMSWSREEPATLEQTRTRLRRFIDEFAAGRALRFAITRPDRPERILGGAHLNERVGPNARDLGYWVRASATRQGIASAAASALAIRALARPDVHRLVIQCDVGNAASEAVALALGFRFTAVVTGAYTDGTRRMLCEFEMLRAEFEARHISRLCRRADRVTVIGDAVI